MKTYLKKNAAKSKKYLYSLFNLHITNDESRT